MYGRVQKVQEMFSIPSTSNNFRKFPISMFTESKRGYLYERNQNS